MARLAAIVASLVVLAPLCVQGQKSANCFARWSFS
jgi:hypothetical protein